MMFNDCQSCRTKGEYRFISIAKSVQGRLLVVCYTERQEHTICIISARLATKQEKNDYENN